MKVFILEGSILYQVGICKNKRSGFLRFVWIQDHTQKRLISKLKQDKNIIVLRKSVDTGLAYCRIGHIKGYFIKGHFFFDESEQKITYDERKLKDLTCP
jgi:hypothetical protein